MHSVPNCRPAKPEPRRYRSRQRGRGPASSLHDIAWGESRARTCDHGTEQDLRRPRATHDQSRGAGEAGHLRLVHARAAPAVHNRARGQHDSIAKYGRPQRLGGQGQVILRTLPSHSVRFCICSPLTCVLQASAAGHGNARRLPREHAEHCFGAAGTIGELPGPATVRQDALRPLCAGNSAHNFGKEGPRGAGSTH